MERFVSQFVGFQDIKQKKEFLVQYLGRLSEVIRSHPLWYSHISYFSTIKIDVSPLNYRAGSSEQEILYACQVIITISFLSERYSKLCEGYGTLPH